MINTTHLSSTMAIAFTPNQFFESFDQLIDDESRIIYMETFRTMNYPFHLESQPDAIIQRFYSGFMPANTIAETFINCFPIPIICREASYRERKPMTLLDCLSADLTEFSDSDTFDRIIDLLRAFRAQGVMNAEWHCSSALKRLYHLDPVYQDDTTMSFSQLEESNLDSDESGYESDYSDLDRDSRVMPMLQPSIDYLYNY